MPYGDLARQRVQRFAHLADLDAAQCTIEEREEYEPHLAAGHAVFAGVDYAAVLAAAEESCHVIVWDGGDAARAIDDRRLLGAGSAPGRGLESP